MLNGTLQLGEITNVEAFCRKALDRKLEKTRARLTPTAYDDALAYLLVEAFKIHAKHNPGLPGAIPFRDKLWNDLQKRVVDWYRQEFGDTRYDQPDKPLSLDYRPANNDDAWRIDPPDPHDDDRREDHLVRAFTGSVMDGPEHRIHELDGLFAQRHSQALLAIPGLGETPTQPAPPRDREPDDDHNQEDLAA